MTLLKKTKIDKDDITNYRPIFNLSVLSKHLERVISKQLVAYLDITWSLSEVSICLSAAHSTETILTAVFSALIEEMDAGNQLTVALESISSF